MTDGKYTDKNSANSKSTTSSIVKKTATRSAVYSAAAIVLILLLVVGLWYFLVSSKTEVLDESPIVNEISKLDETAKQLEDEIATESAEVEGSTQAAPESEAQAPAPTTTPPVSQSDLTAYAAQVLQLVNEQRRQAGVSPLLLQGNSNYVNAANTRAREIAISYSNYRPNGSYFDTVLADNGIAYKAFSENIARKVATPTELVRSLMSYSTTRNNILSPKFAKLAVGVYSDGSANDLYWNLLFTD